MRIPHLLTLLMFSLGSASVLAAPAKSDDMKQLAAHAGCLTCHSIEAKAGGEEPIGPPWVEVARKYHGQKDALNKLTQTVLQGSNPYQSHWKNKVTGLAMPPNAVAIDEADTRKLVAWILSLDAH